MITSGSHRLLELLDKPLVTIVPKGWKTIAKMAEETGLSEAQTRKLVAFAVKDGLLDVRTFKIARQSTVRPVVHYKRRS